MATAITPAQERVAAEKAAYTGEPSARLQKAAALINSGQSVEDAMKAAGYGKRYIAGSAKTFASVLARAGLLEEKKAKKLTPAPKPEVIETPREMETIR